MTGVEGYVESASSGFVAAAVARQLRGEEAIDFTAKTAIGSLGHYVSGYMGDDFQPMNVTFGIMESLPERIRKKANRYAKVAERALEIIRLDSLSWMFQKIDQLRQHICREIKILISQENIYGKNL